MCSIAYSYMGWRRTSPMSASCSWYYPTHHISHDGAVYPDTSMHTISFLGWFTFFLGVKKPGLKAKVYSYLFLSSPPSLTFSSLCVTCMLYDACGIHMCGCKCTCWGARKVVFQSPLSFIIAPNLVVIRAHQTKPWYHQSTQSHM